MATTVDFTMFEGDSKVLNVTVRDTLGALVDLTGVTIIFALAKNAKSEPLFTKAVGSGITIPDPEGGVFEVVLDPENTRGLKGKLYYEAEVNDAGTLSTVLTGWVAFLESLIDP